MQWSKGFTGATSRLEQLEEFESYSPFCRALYRLIVDWIEKCPSQTSDLYGVFVSFLEAELEHHRALHALGVESLEGLPRWIGICSYKASELHHTLAQLVSLPTRSGAPAVVKHLLSAECFQQLGRPDLVALGMQAAIDEGCDHPLIHFALGYNIYLRAVKQYTSFDPASGRQIVQEPLQFEQECRRAVEALQRGICESPYDAQLYWWMGSILENLGAHPEARKAFEHVVELDPETYGEVIQEKLRVLSPPIPDAQSDEERERLSLMSEITVDEILDAFRDVETVRDLVEKSHPLEDRSLRDVD